MAYGRFEHRVPLLALRYHGYQFGTYNPQLGDGRGFLYGQLRDRTGMLQDLGSKGSGTTPWSRGGDGRLTLKGGCLLYTSPSPRDLSTSRMPSSA